MTTLPFPEGRSVDIACLGRLAVDLYADQIGCSLEAANSFSKYLGGSSANIAFGAARLGVRSAMISRIGDEQNGNFLLEVLNKEGCDVSQIQIDKHRLTGMVLLGIKDQNSFPLLFARENCADMAIEADGISETFISKCRSLLITGTHLSNPTVLAASTRALDYAGKHGVIRVLDIDYRPVLWGLTGRGDGETRYIKNDKVSSHIQRQLAHFELILGTEEEWMIAGGVEGDLMACLRKARDCTDAVFVVKRGALGCSIIPAAIPGKIDDAQTILGERVEVLNVLGAGDAFASGLMAGLLTGKGWEASARIANACGAIVVSRHGCAPAMPTPAELAHWFSGNRHPKPDQDPQLSHLHRVSARRAEWPEIFVLAYDHRSQFEALASELAIEPARLPAVKVLLTEAVAELQTENPSLRGQLGVLIDGRANLGEKSLHAATGRGWWIGRPVERPSSRPLRFDGSASIGSQLKSWPLEHTVKCLVSYHPDDPTSIRDEQEEYIRQLWEATRISGHGLLLEIIPPKGSPGADGDGEVVVRAVRRLYDLGFKPEWWKVPAMRAKQWAAMDALVAQQDPYCCGAVILGLSQPIEQLISDFASAQAPLVKGFMVGRSVWHEPTKAWLQGALTDSAFKALVKARFLDLVQGWRASRKGAVKSPAFITDLSTLAVV